MTELYGWVRNITCYLIFMTVITNILPNKKYEKYIRLFAGMVLILIVLKPLTSGLRLDDQIAYFFESITFQSQAEDFKKELAGMEEQRLGTMVEQYEQAVELDVKNMAEDEGLYPRRVKITIENDRSSQRFGTVTSVFAVLGVSAPGEDGFHGFSDMEPVTPIEPVRIGSEAGAESIGAAAEQEAEDTDLAGLKAAGQENSAADRTPAGDDPAVRAFRQKLIQYYNLEEQDVEIQLEDG